jgi:hypothetical protein
VERNLERQWIEARIAARDYRRDYPDGDWPRVPADRLATWITPGDCSSSFQPV